MLPVYHYRGSSSARSAALGQHSAASPALGMARVYAPALPPLSDATERLFMAMEPAISVLILHHCHILAVIARPYLLTLLLPGLRDVLQVPCADIPTALL
ncbi:hypothetical protein J6590_016575 [Homalodisca vitripennis]|nr:hypothetical protein J6590_016575 [Homalodisca vitripennis]